MGEAVTMSQHMEQSAACAVADGAPDSLVISALLHDIGHFIGEHPIEALENGIDNNHEDVGARYLEPYFPASITEPMWLPSATFVQPMTNILAACPMPRLIRSRFRACR